MNKVKTFRQISNISKGLKKKGESIVFTNGCFDILHVGHIRLLRKAKAEGDVLILGLNTDSSVRRIKGRPRPFMREKERAEILSALEMVDFIVLFGEDTPERLIEIVKPDVLVKGGDYRIDKIVGREFIERSGGRIAVFPYVRNRSTSGIVHRIRSSA